MMNELIRRGSHYSPAIFSTAFDSMLDEMFNTPAWFGKEKVSYPMNVVTLSRNGEVTGCRLEYALAGFGKDDISLSLDGDILRIEAEHGQKEEGEFDEKYQHNGIAYRKLSASYKLMDDADRDNISSKFENGLLSITIMLKGNEQKALAPRRIEIE